MRKIGGYPSGTFLQNNIGINMESKTRNPSVYFSLDDL